MSFRPAIKLVAFIVAVFWGWDRAISHNGLLRYIDRNPETVKADTILFTLASYHELFNRNQKALEIYSRVVKRYPKSRHAEPSQFGVAVSHERLHDMRTAISEYKVYLKNYPEGRYSRSVRQNLNILDNG